MSILTAHSEILERIQKIENREKYAHLMNSVNKTNEEQELYDWIIRLNKNIDIITQCENNSQKTLFESDCRLLIPQINKILDKLSWC